MENPDALKYSDLIKPDNSIEQLIGQLKEVISQYDTLKSKMQTSAGEMAKGLQAVSGATEDQRKAIQQTTEQTEKLTEDYKQAFAAQMQAKQAVLEYKAAKKEEETVTKLLQQINTSAEGSYNRLSAQYRLNKLRLNEMSAAQRTATEEGRKLEAETAQIYEQMNQLQKATGKFSLQVGNYEIAGKSLKGAMREMAEELAELNLKGEGTSQRAEALRTKLGQMRDAMDDAKQQINNTASDTAKLDAVMGGASAARGGIGAFAGILGLVGINSNKLSKTQKLLAGTIGIVSGAIAVQNALQRESALMIGISTIQTKALAKAEVYERLIKIKGTEATWAAVAAQKALNLVAKANPYVLLGTALAAVVGGIIAFSSSSDKAKKSTEDFNLAIDDQINLLKERFDIAARRIDADIEREKSRLEIAKARGASDAELNKIEDEIYSKEKKRIEAQKKLFQGEINSRDVIIRQLDVYKSNLSAIMEAEQMGAENIKLDLYADHEIATYLLKDAKGWTEEFITNAEARLKIADEILKKEIDLETQRQIEEEQRKKAAREAAKTELAEVRKAEDMRLALIQDGFQKELAKTAANYDRQIDDLKLRLRQEANLTAKAREAINQQIALLEDEKMRKLVIVAQKYDKAELAARRETEDARIKLMADGADKEREQLRVQYERRIEDLRNELKEENDLTAEQRSELEKQLLLTEQEYTKESLKLEKNLQIKKLQAANSGIELRISALDEGTKEEIDLSVQMWENKRQIELEQNALLAEDLRQDEAAINAKWDAYILKHTAELEKKRAELILNRQQDLLQSEFDLLDRNERQKTIFSLKQEQARLQSLLDLDKKAGKKMTEQERKAMENTLAAIKREVASTGYNNLYELLGLNITSGQQDALNTALDSVKDSIGGVIDAWKEAADRAVDSADKQVESAERILQAEIEARNAGYANNVETAKRELDLAKRTQREAQQERARAQKAELAADAAMQSSSLITATANIWKALSGIPGFGPALAVTAIATMWGSFIASKAKAAELTEKYGEGTIELLQGGSHASGNDIDLGRKRDGTRRRAEGGEFFAVINKRSSRRFRSVIPDVINSFNNGTFAERYQRANGALDGMAMSFAGTDVSGLERDVRAIRSQGETTLTQQGGYIVERYKNLTKKYKA